MRPPILPALILTCAPSALCWLLLHAVEALWQEDLNSHEMEEGVHRHPERGGQEIHGLPYGLTATNWVGLVNHAHVQLRGKNNDRGAE